MQRGQRDLRGADEEQLVALDLVDHLALAREEAGAVERPLADEDRRDDRARSPRARDELDGEADQRQLDHHQVAEQVGEARARGRRRPSPSRSSRARAPRSRWSRGSKPKLGPLADLAQGDRVVVGLAVGRRRGRAGSAASAASASRRCLDLGELGLELLDLAETSRISAIASSASPPARFASAIASEASFAGARGAPRPRAAARGGGRRASSSLVELLGGAAARQRRARRLGVLADALQVERGGPPSGPSHHGVVLVCAGPRARDLLGPGVLGDELRDRVGLVAGDDVLRHDRAGEAAVADREQGVARSSRALVEVRALDADAARVRSPACRPASACGSRRSAARRARPRRRSGSSSETEISSDAAGAEREARPRRL